MKAILRWRLVIDSPKMKALFDHMVRCGYPASARWCETGGVPFSTPPSAETFNIAKLPCAISFERHVRPLYKMFIKAFYVRHDIRAARTVVGILKEEEMVSERKREEREQVRRKGLVGKKIGVGM